jgi:polar amino acid transport system substrate-binding protein
MFDSFYNNLIAEADMTRASDLIRSRTFEAFFPLIVTAIIYFLVAWLIGVMLTSLVQRQHRKAIASSVALLLFGAAGFVPTLFQSSDETAAAKKDAPAVFQALDGKRVGVVIGSIQDIAVTDFMVENMDSTPLSDAQRSELSGQCQQVVEEPTGRGFRVKLII